MSIREKTKHLKENGAFNPKASEVRDELFLKNCFFDPHDIVQVKYEMLRKVEKEQVEVKEAARLFGMSRPYYYRIKTAFDQKGITGLLPEKRGPKRPFKVTDEVVRFINEAVKADPSATNQQIADKIESSLAVTFHPRTIERIRKTQKKRKKGA